MEVYALDQRLLTGWTSPPVAAYRGAHGLHVEQGAWEKSAALFELIGDLVDAGLNAGFVNTRRAGHADAADDVVADFDG